MHSFCRDGYKPELAAVATGSHTDAIPYSGKYDGVVGVLGAIEAINVLKRFAVPIHFMFEMKSQMYGVTITILILLFFLLFFFEREI